jgi:hypothetical protein
MNKAVITLTLASLVMTGCASISYETQCALPLEKEPSISKIDSATKVIRENYVYTERVFYSANEWVVFADKTGRNMSLKSGAGDYISGTGNFLKDSEFEITEVKSVKGQWDISQTNPKCYSLLNDGEMTKGFLATSSAYPFSMKDETEAAWKVDYFDLYHPANVARDGKLTLKHKNSDNNLVLEEVDGSYTVNGEEARLVPSNMPFADTAIKVESSGDMYLIIGMKREANSNKFYVMKNKSSLFAMTGPKL